jgi:hypothetical protein
VFQTYDNYLQYVEQPDLLQDFPMAQRYRRRCVAHVHIQVIKTIQVLVTKGVNANSGELSPITVSRQQSFKSEYLLITIWDNIARVAQEVDPEFRLDHPAASLLGNTSNLQRDGETSRLIFFMGLTPNQVRLNSIKKISRDFELDRHELFRQVHGFDVLNQKVFNQYLETIDGINKQLVVERFYQRDVMTMIQDINRFGTGEVDLPITNADVHRHLEFLALCLGITNLTTSALWTLDLPSLDISAETETSLAAYRESQAIRQGRRQEHTREQERDAKRRKFFEMEEIEINEDDIVTWLQELPDDVSDGGPTQVRYEPAPSHQLLQVVAPHTP